MSDTAIDSQAYSFEDFFEESLCGYAIADNTGKIARINARLANWLQSSAASCVGRRFSDILTMGGKIYYETHLAPLLRMQGHFDEIALEVRSEDGARLPVLVNALARTGKNGEPLFTRWTIFKATDRRTYEQNMRDAHAETLKALTGEQEVSVLREQFIAVLGHDLRSPLGGVLGALTALDRLVVDEKARQMIAIATSSADRMAGLISDVMDFARGRLGGGMVIDLKAVDMLPFLRTVVAEQQAANPDRCIETHFDNDMVIACDSRRLSQLLTNLLANAITHGSKTGVITLTAKIQDSQFELVVANSGTPIPAETIIHIFEPFKREDARPSQNGLGLGLYIAAEIARAHNGSLVVTSDEIETRCTLTMPAR